MTRTPPSDSVSRPVTSALILPRSRKMGRIVLNAYCSINTNAPITANTVSVTETLRCISQRNATAAVNRPPTKSTSPVPTRLRTPSTSVMMRATSVPVRFSS